MGRLHGRYVQLFKLLPNCFPKQLYYFKFLPAVYESCSFSICIPVNTQHDQSFILAILPSPVCIVSHRDFNLHFPHNDDVKDHPCRWHKDGLKFTSWPMCIQSFYHHQLKTLCSLHCVTLHLGQNLIVHTCVGLFLNSIFCSVDLFAVPYANNVSF